MNRYLALRHLCWKETRQVLPLVWMQLALAVGLHVLLLVHPQSASAWTLTPKILLFAGMPSLFALGVGALLVGQEKERRSLEWLRSLPVRTGDVLRVKLAVGLVALIVVWGLNLLLLAVLVLPRHPSLTTASVAGWRFDPGWEYLFPLQSVFFLLAGFATAWMFRSSLVSLLALIPLALLPGAVSYALHHLVRRVGRSEWTHMDPSPWTWAAAFVVLSLLLLAVGWRRGRESLAAETFRERRRLRSLSLFHPWKQTQLWTDPPHAPTAMLVWQFVRQNRTVLLGLAAMLLFALGLLIGASLGSGRSVVATLLMLLSTSWLGVLAFHGDSLYGRIRFLAERGVSPAQTWYTRHAVPLGLLAVILSVFVILLPDALVPNELAVMRSSPPATLSAVFFVLFTYGVSQAVGQILPSATIAAIAAPVVTYMLVGYGVLVAWFGVPVWLIGVLALCPWLATFVAMRRWMDGRVGWRFWGVHAGFLAFGIFVPLVPVGWVMALQPAMPGAVRRQLTAEARDYGIDYREPWEVVLQFRKPESRNRELSDVLVRDGRVEDREGWIPGGGMGGMEGASEDLPPQSRAVEGQIVRERLEHDLSIVPGPLRFMPHVFRYLLGEVRWAQMALEHDSEAALQRERYRHTLSLLETMVRRLRLSWRIFDQDGADLIEIWLVRELARPEAETRLGRELYAELVRSLGDDAARHAARRRAVVMSWAAYRAQFRSRAPDLQIGGYWWPLRDASVVYLVNPYSRRRAADYLTWRLLQRLEERGPWDSEERIRELARYWGVPAVLYGLGPGGEFLRADNPETFAFPGESRRVPGSQWHAGWEQRARELAASLED